MLEKLPKIRGQYRQNAKLKSWFDVGGNAEILFKPADIADLQHFLKQRPKEISLTVLGAMSNVIIRDGGIEGVVIKLGGAFANVKIADEIITVGCAALCGNVATHLKMAGLTGLEFLSGIPGSIGGAIAMNAGCYNGDISQVLISAKALDYNGNLVELSNFATVSDFNFGYRENKIAANYIFVEARFKAIKSGVAEVSRKIEELCQKRELTQPIRAKTGGSTFKNPFPDDLTQKKAWQLIDEAGCRGLRLNDAQMSEKHCNFMINTNKARASDLIDLGNNIKDLVKKKSGIDLKWEIKILGRN